MSIKWSDPSLAMASASGGGPCVRKRVTAYRDTAARDELSDFSSPALFLATFLNVPPIFQPISDLMSGEIAMDTSDDAQNLLPNPQDAQTADDPTASLRAAALRTLRAKRRKVNVPEAPPVLPRHLTSAQAPSITLDYGEDVSMSPAPPQTAITSVLQSTQSDDAHMREEGEISDSEEPSAPPMTSQVVSPVASRSLSKPPQHKSSPTSRPLETEAIPIKAEARGVTRSPQRQSHSLVPPSSSIDPELLRIDETHARPGLKMTQSQYETAKDIIIDLLGWGVPPEYLVDCGLSREIIFYVFTELNFRFPRNFENPPHAQPAYHGSPEPLTPPPFIDRIQRSGSLSTSSPSTIPSRPIQGHPSLPQKPSAPQGELPTSPILTATPIAHTTSSTSTSLPQPPSLLDIEQQRRQELLARKAVLASRKRKSPSVTLPPVQASQQVQAQLPTPPESKKVVLEETVDNFLNSINSTHSDAGDEKTPSASEQPLNDMDVDEPPGLSGIQENPPSDATSRPPISTTRPIPGSGSAPPSVVPVSQSVQHSAPLSPSPHLASGPSSSSGSRGSTASLPTGPTLRDHQRRGMKRPVAADFVDMEPTYPRYHATNGYNSSTHRQSTIRQKTGSFAGVTSGMRRMVINLSDTEDEDDEPGNNDEVPESSITSMSGRIIRAPPRHARRLEGTGIIASSINVTPALLEKEQEIKRMRDRIAAEKEKLRQKKLASLGNPTSPPLSAPATVKVKQEDLSPPPSLAPQPLDSRNIQPECEIPDQHPPHDVSNGPPHLTRGDKEEPQPEQAARIYSPIDASFSTSSTPEPSRPTSVSQVDAVKPTEETSSAQANIQPHILEVPHESPSSFQPYQSPLSLYPMLRSHSRPSSAGQSKSFGSSFILASIDFEALKTSAARKVLSVSSNRVCQYEVPGGGECRDKDCEDIHLSRLTTIEPTDDETAQYLCELMPSGSVVSFKDIKTALENARSRSVEPSKAHNNTTLEGRVAEALVSLNLR